MHLIMLKIVLLAAVVCLGACYVCVLKNISSGKNVCVCNSTFCGELIFERSELKAGNFISYTSSKQGLRFAKSIGKFSTKNEWMNYTGPDWRNKPFVELKKANKYQTIIGFGGAFTDSTGFNLKHISEGSQKRLLEAYFSSKGIQYSLGRVPMGGTDFSITPYTYNDYIYNQREDLEQIYFNLTYSDYEYKIAYILEALKLTNKELKLISCPWSAPRWMKTNNALNGTGVLKGIPGGPYYESWAKYFIKFLDAYQKAGINFWAVTAQNEPDICLGRNIDTGGLNCLGFTAAMQTDFVKFNLGPAINRSQHSEVKIIMYDDLTPTIQSWVETVLADTDAYKFISGIGFHWYMNAETTLNVLSQVHQSFPDKFILSTEACEGVRDIISGLLKRPVDLGSWDRGDHYFQDIMDNMENWGAGWVDWNLALNLEGGPNWISNFVDSPVIVDWLTDEFYLQPMFFALGHFSKFVRPGAIRIGTQSIQVPDGVRVVAFEGPGPIITLVIANRLSAGVVLNILDADRGLLMLALTPSSFTTVVWLGK